MMKLGLHSAILPDDTFEEVIDYAAKVGFKDPLYFSKAFKKSFGMSPVKFRREKGIMAPKRSVSSGCD